MVQIHSLVFNPFQENTYILYDETKECAIIDAGMYSSDEQAKLVKTIETLDLKPVIALQTHLHIDHVFGCSFILEKYGLAPQAHIADEFILENTKSYARQFGVNLKETPPALGGYLEEGDEVKFGNTVLKVIHVPGHSPGGVLFYNLQLGILVSGDVLFKGSIGRSDLSGGNQHELISGIQAKVMVLPDDVIVYPGHGSSTTIGFERISNPFL